MKDLARLTLSIFVFLTITFTTAKAQQAIALGELIDITLENNYSLRIISNQQQIAINNFTRGNAGLLPSVDLRSGFSGNINNSEQRFSNDTQNSLRNIHNTNTQASLQAGWMLFDGFRGQIRYRQLEELMALSEITTRISIENTIARVASEYYYFVQQRQLFSNLQYAVDLSRERVRIEEEHFLLGSGSKVRLLQAQVNLNADSSRLERQYEVLAANRVRIAELMALPDLNENFIPDDTTIVINKILNYNELLSQAMENNASVIAAKHNLVISEQDLDMTRSRRYPYLNLTSGYGYNYNTFQTGTLTSQQTWGMNYALTLGINLYNGGNQRRQESNARIGIENRQLMLEQTIQEVTADLITIFNSYLNNLRLLELETQNLDVARENLDIAFDRYRLGALSGFELREVQKNLLEAEERLLSIQYQAKMAEISLMQITGRIIGYQGVL